MDRMQMGKAFGGKQRLTATAAAITDEIYPPHVVFTELHQIVFIGLVQQLSPFYDIYSASVTVAYKRVC